MYFSLPLPPQVNFMSAQMLAAASKDSLVSTGMWECLSYIIVELIQFVNSLALSRYINFVHLYHTSLQVRVLMR